MEDFVFTNFGRKYKCVESLHILIFVSQKVKNHSHSFLHTHIHSFSKHILTMAKGISIMEMNKNDPKHSCIWPFDGYFT